NGTLQVGTGGTGGSIGGGNVANFSRLEFNRSDTYNLFNLVSGTGQLIQNGGGTLQLTVLNTYSGITYISNGVLEVATGGRLGFGNVSNNTVLVYSSTSPGTVSNLIAGIGSLIKNAATGDLVLSNANT